MEVTITPDYLTMGTDLNQKELAHLINLMMNDNEKRTELFNKLADQKRRLEFTQGIDYGC